MGKEFGNLARMNRQIYFSLSPFEQKAFAGAFTKGAVNMMRRFAGSFFTVAPRKFLIILHFFLKTTIKFNSQVEINPERTTFA